MHYIPKAFQKTNSVLSGERPERSSSYVRTRDHDKTEDGFLKGAGYKNKRILVGLTASAAVHKALDLVRLLTTNGAVVKCLPTKRAEAIITSEILTTLPADVLISNEPSNLCSEMMHIDLARWAELILIIPATANFIGKLAHGLADDNLSSICLASAAPVVVVPAMNKIMWEKLVVQENISKLKAFGVRVLGPVEGNQACGDFGYGRMIEPNDVLEFMDEHFNDSKSLEGTNILITSGPTEENIDAVRFISNRSSGKMGCALAHAAINAGAKVLFISGPALYPNGCEVIKVKTAEEMHNAVIKNMPDYDIFISCAAVADFRVKTSFKGKLKKKTLPDTLTLVLNPDILKEVKKKFPKKLCVGFAAETENLRKNALEKLKAKKLDIIIANLVGEDKGFGSDYNKVLIIDKHANSLELEEDTKAQIAQGILKYLANYMRIVSDIGR